MCYMKCCLSINCQTTQRREETEEKEKKGCDGTLSFTYINNLSHFSSHFCIIMIIHHIFFSSLMANWGATHLYRPRRPGQGPARR